MTDNPCNCETCDKNKEHWIHGPDCPFQGYDYTANQREAVVRITGCLSHPKALEYLMKGVIEELERRRQIAYTRMNTYMDLGHDGNWQGGMEDAFAEAIALIKEGVKK